jgi:hypothetical protein
LIHILLRFESNRRYRFLNGIGSISVTFPHAIAFTAEAVSSTRFFDYHSRICSRIGRENHISLIIGHGIADDCSIEWQSISNLSVESSEFSSQPQPEARRPLALKRAKRAIPNLAANTTGTLYFPSTLDALGLLASHLTAQFGGNIREKGAVEILPNHVVNSTCASQKGADFRNDLFSLAGRIRPMDLLGFQLAQTAPTYRVSNQF